MLGDFIPESRFHQAGYKGILAGKGNSALRARTAEQLVAAASLIQRQREASRYILNALTDPQKLASLKGARPANGRFHKIMFHLYEAERNGESPAKVLRESLRPDARPEFYYDQALTQSNLLESYDRAKQLGIFDSAENLQRMSRGRAPTIVLGPNAGQIVEVDHAIPRAVAPELTSNLANLRYLAESVHSMRPRPPQLDSDAIAKINQMKAAGWTFSETPAQAALVP